MNVKTNRPTETSLQRLARLAEEASGDKPTPSVKTVVADCLAVIETYRRNGHGWASIAQDLAAEGILYTEGEGDNGASGREGEDIPQSAGTGVTTSPGTPAEKRNTTRQPIKASTLRATAWSLNRELGDRYDLHGRAHAR